MNLTFSLSSDDLAKAGGLDPAATETYIRDHHDEFVETVTDGAVRKLVSSGVAKVTEEPATP